jgi:excisionase family DNA binding protein
MHMNSHRHPGNEIRFFTIPQVAERLNVSTRTIRRWIANDALVVHRFEGVVRLAESDLKLFFAQHRDV